MQTRLTLNIDRDVVESAKDYAHKNGKNLSKLVESYLKLISEKSDDFNEIEISENVRSLMGSIQMEKDFEYKTELSKAISEKHLK